jgi:RecA-family ATPase
MPDSFSKLGGSCLAYILNGDDYLALPRGNQTWIVQDLLPVGGGMLLYGDPKVGKSFAALQLADAIVQGNQWLGFPVPAAKTVAYIQLDTPQSLWADRVQALKEKAGLAVGKIQFADRETLETQPFYISNPQHWGRLREAVTATKPDVVIIDTIKEACTGVNENDSSEMQEAYGQLVAATLPAALIVIAHARKSNPEQGYDLMNDNRGSNYMVGRMDSICRFSRSSMNVVSRTVEQHSIKLEREDTGLWSLAEDPFKAELELAVQQAPIPIVVRQLASVLSQRTGKSEEACRTALRRYLRKTP